ncbi:hypothetical protein GOP47_0019027 [Adiantum capillus-veneris]|uniref:Uncharacterized protein n=1 Tax=Adiantum capillus-veneris TaxID=13818 RepID=A0A9D4UEB2_ADICA|nr:hypothetical protein GOP47_0019027 [Adiantum capillus-veneris]
MQSSALTKAKDAFELARSGIGPESSHCSPCFSLNFTGFCVRFSTLLSLRFRSRTFLHLLVLFWFFRAASLSHLNEISIPYLLRSLGFATALILSSSRKESSDVS